MSDLTGKPHGLQPPPGSGQHPLPRRAPPDKSITLRHHRLARAASLKANPDADVSSTPRRNSSGESHVTGNSDPKTWFDQSNENPRTFDSHAMDVDPPFYQKETDSSNEDGPKRQQPLPFGPSKSATLKPAATSSGSDDYRSVIDDLTIEIQRLKEQLKRYKQLGSEHMKKEKLFEIKVHGLPKRKKRELEATLRDFAAGLGRTPSAEASSSQRPKSSRRHDRMYSASGSNSKYQTSSSGSRSRPVDSAYASMSIGAHSSGTSLVRPSINNSKTRSTDMKVEDYLKDIPEGLYPRHMAMSEKEKKKMVVRRLEHLFTGKLGGKPGKQYRHPKSAHSSSTGPAPVMVESQAGSTTIHQPPSLQPAQPAQPSREAKILSSDGSNKKSRSRDNMSMSHSNGDGTDSAGNAAGNTSSRTNTTPPIASPHEQRPTRPRDLDPDRVQIPSENMDYIRHLGLVPPELLAQQEAVEDVSPDAEGWVYLNLLCNLAQLHMMNVAPGFIRAAVAERSTKLQLSPDGRKIRWRGGTNGTKFASDSSPDYSQKSPLTDDTDASNEDGQRKRQKTQQTSESNLASGTSSKNARFIPKQAGSLQSFHYKPLLGRKSSSDGQASVDDSSSSSGAGEDSNVGGSRWDAGASASSPSKKRRLDGPIIYYSAAPFFIDLSGDGGDASPATHMASTERDGNFSASTSVAVETSPSLRPMVIRTSSGSSLPFRPLASELRTLHEDEAFGDAGSPPGLVPDDTDDNLDEFEFDTPWSDAQQVLGECNLEACGIGGVTPDDHFSVVVKSRWSRNAVRPSLERRRSSHESVIRHLASLSTSPRASRPGRSRPRRQSPSVKIEYLAGRIKRLAPVPLPPAATFFSPFSTDSSGGSDEYESDEAEALNESSEELMSRRANPHQSDKDYPDNEDMTSADEEGGEPDDEEPPAPAGVGMMIKGGFEKMAKEGSAERSEERRAVPGRGATSTLLGGETDGTATPPAENLLRTGSSVATAGGAESVCLSSSGEDG